MTAKDYLRGHPIVFTNNEWVYSDTNESTADTWQKRPCGHCGLHDTPEGHDGCLGTLPGVMNACCGHGGKHEGAYVQFLDKTCIRHNDALEIMDVLKKYVRRSRNGKWRCIKSFSVTLYDEDEEIIEDEEKRVELGSEWIKDEDNVPSLNEIRLENDSDWLEIDEETFENCFEKSEGSF